MEQLGELTSNDGDRPLGQGRPPLAAELGPEMSGQPEKAAATLQELQALAAKEASFESAVGDRALLLRLSRARYALVRRLDVWSEVCRIEAAGHVQAPGPLIDPAAMQACLAEIDAVFQDRPERAAWEKFLDLAALHDWCKQSHTPQDRVPRALALAILKRMDASEMLPPQRQFIITGPIGALQQELLRHVAETADLDRAFLRMERYEQTRLGGDARLLAEECRFLAPSPGEEYRRLGVAIERHYRNANLRLAVSGELLNRLIPSAVAGVCRGERHRGGVAGARPEHDVDAGSRGVVAQSRPAAVVLGGHGSGFLVDFRDQRAGDVHQRQRFDVCAHKPMEVDLAGIRLGETQVEVYNQTKLRSVRPISTAFRCSARWSTASPARSTSKGSRN